MGLFDFFNPVRMEDEPHVLNEGTDIRRKVDEFPGSYDVPPENYYTGDAVDVPYGTRTTEPMENWSTGEYTDRSMPASVAMGNIMNALKGKGEDFVDYMGGQVENSHSSYDEVPLALDIPEQADKTWNPAGAAAGMVPPEYLGEEVVRPEGLIPSMDSFTGDPSDIIGDTPAGMVPPEYLGMEMVEEYTPDPETSVRPQVRPIDLEVDPKVDSGMTPEEQEVAVADTSDASGNPNPDVAKVVAADPKGWKKAMGWVTDTFGINGQDLARFALFYAGSRVAGYSHSDSMTFGFDTAMTDHRGRMAFTQQASQKGIYTQDSLDQFKRTGDYKSLKLAKVANPHKIDLTKSYLNKNGNRAYVSTDKAGNKQFVDGSGKPVRGEYFAEDEPETRREIVENYTPTFKSILDENVDLDTDDPEFNKFKVTGTEGAVAGAEIIIDEANRLGLDINSAFMTQVYGNAVRAAQADSKGKDGRVVTNLAPYIKAQLRYYDSPEPWAGALGVAGERMPVEEWYSIQGALLHKFQDDPAYKEALRAVGEGVVVDKFMENLYGEYQGIEDKSQYIKREGKGSTGFKTWLKSELGL